MVNLLNDFTQGTGDAFADVLALCGSNGRGEWEEGGLGGKGSCWWRVKDYDKRNFHDTGMVMHNEKFS